METTRPTETVEDYLQLIYTMHREGTPVIAARVKERKGVSAPTAWATLKRMERDGLVELGDDHHIVLSKKGLEMAESIIRRHMLAERLLTDILKLDWADVHDEAHKMEHAISPLIERQILQLLENPETCPHGNPIPGLHSGRPSSAVPLRDVEEGSTVVVNNIAEHAEDDAASCTTSSAAASCRARACTSTRSRAPTRRSRFRCWTRTARSWLACTRPTSYSCATPASLPA
jgi:DtxR family Mn-dependent transcriptional regulator